MGSVRRAATVYLVLAAAGAFVALLLTSFHVSVGAEARLCSTAAGCGTVNASPYSKVAGIPIALMGLGAYVVIGGIALASLKRESVRAWSAVVIFGISLVGVLYSAYLTYLELYVIRAVCPWCVASAVIMTLIWMASMVELWHRHRLATQPAT